MPVVSAGLLLFRQTSGQVEVLLVHPGGPLWARRDAGAWSIPKGLCNAGEAPIDAARREFAEETGVEPTGTLLPLGSVKYSGGKIVHAWAFGGDCDPARVRSNDFEMQWPPRSGKRARFPEIDRADFFSLPVARTKLLAAQAPFVDRLEDALRGV